MLIRPAIAAHSSNDPTQSPWQLPHIPIPFLTSISAAYSGGLPHGQPSPFPLAPVSNYNSTLHCFDGGSTSQMPSAYTQWLSYLSSGTRSSANPAAFSQQSGAVSAHAFSGNGYSQTEYGDTRIYTPAPWANIWNSQVVFSPRQTSQPVLKTHRDPIQRKAKHKGTTNQPVTILVYRRKHRPAAEFTSNIRELQTRCLIDGGDPEAVDLLPSIFSQGISQEALSRPLTRMEADQYTDGTSGQVYRMLLQVDGGDRFRCRLCAVDDDGSGWKHARDALRHLKRDHFGLGNSCDKW